MKKSILIALFVVLSLLLSCSYVMATNDNNLAEGVKNTVNNAENMAESAGNSAGVAIKNGANDVKNVTEDAMNGAKNGAENVGNDVKNGMQNMGNDANNAMNNMNNQNNNDYTATRTAAEQNTGNTTQNWMNRDIWTWIIVGIITIIIVALIWYYASRNNR